MTPGAHELESQKQNKSGGANTDTPLPEGYRVTELGPLPEEWRVVRLGEVADTKMGGTPNTKVTEYWTPPEVVWITPGNLEQSDVKIVSASKRKISRLSLEKSSAKKRRREPFCYQRLLPLEKLG